VIQRRRNTVDKEKTKKPKKVDRRGFLKGLGGGALGTAVVPTLLKGRGGSDQKQFAGVALSTHKTISFRVNGRSVKLKIHVDENLLSVLRDRLNLTGAKRTCDRGECGGCTVLLDGKPVYGCLTPAVRADGHEVTTVEGLSQDGKLHPIQEAFIDEDGYQCGFCTPGFIMSTAALLKANPDPTQEEIKEGLSGNLCRCGNYPRIYQAVSTAAKKMRSPSDG
jgi:aerobic-type carbon monoxide dehydrogenase small subunit (CoxS/CutS family)